VTDKVKVQLGQAMTIYGSYLREYLTRGWAIRKAVTEALRQTGVLEQATEAGIEKECRRVYDEMQRLAAAKDEGHEVMRGVVIEREKS
jgi:hypothetical protein